jgi:hypothetical protein
MREIFNNFKNENENIKENRNEKELYYILQSIMPTDEIIEVGKETAK